MQRLGQLRFLASKAIRRGHRTVLLTPNPGPRFGNFLYYWLQAYCQQGDGRNYRVQVHDHLEPWLRDLPTVRDQLSVRTAGLGFFDRRDWPPVGQFQRVGSDFERRQLGAFVNEHLTGSPLLARSEIADDSVVVNVRRGDYYSVTKFRDLYAYNVPAYVESALRRAEAIEPVREVCVISDDVQWSRENLDAVLRSGGATVKYGPKDPGPKGDFRALATATRIIGTNSTFSYWGAYIATVRHGPKAHILMPRFMSRQLTNGGRATQLLPEWDVIESIPGGWTCPPN